VINARNGRDGRISSGVNQEPAVVTRQEIGDLLALGPMGQWTAKVFPNSERRKGRIQICVSK
jgi:hypothetical protein